MVRKKSINKKAILAFILGILVVVLGFKFISKPGEDDMATFSTDIVTLKENADDYILGSYETEYKKLISEIEDAIESKDKEKSEELLGKLKDLEKKVIAENKEMCTSYIDKIKSINIDSLDDDKKKEIKSSIDDIEKLISENKFKAAKDNLDTLEKKIDNLLENIKSQQSNNINSSNNNDNSSTGQNTNSDKDTQASQDKVALEEKALELVKREDKEFFDTLNGEYKLTSDDTVTLEGLNVEGITEKVKFFTVDVILGEDGYCVGSYLIGVDSGNVYRGPSNGAAYFELIKDGKVVQRFDSPESKAELNE